MEEILSFAKKAFVNGAAKPMTERQFKMLFDKEYSPTAYDLSDMRSSILYLEYFNENALICNNGVFFRVMKGYEDLLSELKRKTILNTVIDDNMISGEIKGGKVIAYHPQGSTSLAKYMQKALNIEKE